ncbi:MAG: hypothetical protein WC992_03130 [Acholeplasmataceae bacterium]
MIAQTVVHSVDGAVVSVEPVTLAGAVVTRVLGGPEVEVGDVVYVTERPAPRVVGVADDRGEPVEVVFRRWPDGGVIALFPELLADHRGRVESFEHVGQHYAADYVGVLAQTSPATPEEYKDLRWELESAPYRYVLVVREVGGSETEISDDR